MKKINFLAPIHYVVETSIRINKRRFLFISSVLIVSTCLLSSCSEKLDIDNPLYLPDLNTYESAEPMPDFTQWAAGKARKQAFFDFLLPRIHSENKRILMIRTGIKNLVKQSIDKPLNRNQLNWIKTICERYQLDNECKKTLETKKISRPFNETLLRRINVIPPSLAIVQAANESAWGTSRFAQQGNSLFGQWCFSNGCGIKPKARNEGASHEVKKFKHPAASIRSYFVNLNSHPAYKNLRQIRLSLIQQNKVLTGGDLAAGLRQYSERGSEYIDELKEMIKFNHLAQQDMVLKQMLDKTRNVKNE